MIRLNVTLIQIFRTCNSFKQKNFQGFYIYHRLIKDEDNGNIHLRLFSRRGFLADLNDCEGVISNAGFELLSEALYLGKKLLAKPLAGQMEQASNAFVISELNLGMIMKKLDPDAIEQFLAAPVIEPMRYPDVARIVAEWIESGNWEDVEGIVRLAWKDIKFR